MYRKRNLLGIESQLSERGNYIGIQENSDGTGIHVFIIQYNNDGSVDVSQCTSNPSHGKIKKLLDILKRFIMIIPKSFMMMSGENVNTII